MGLDRRQMIMAALSAGVGSMVLTGCSSIQRSSRTIRPVANPGSVGGPAARGGYEDIYPAPPRQPIIGHHHHSNPPTRTVATPRSTASINAIGRSNWTRKAPVGSKVNPMGSVSKITVHHEGWNAVWFSDRKTTGERIEKIRRFHVEDRGWGDIGYHYIVDRSGRVWEGRPIQYQGAHVSRNNENNIGILVLGNFDKQSPSSAQLKGLYDTCDKLASLHRVKRSMIRSHQEINKSQCPGKNLQRQMNALRRHVG